MQRHAACSGCGTFGRSDLKSTPKSIAGPDRTRAPPSPHQGRRQGAATGPSRRYGHHPDLSTPSLLTAGPPPRPARPRRTSRRLQPYRFTPRPLLRGPTAIIGISHPSDLQEPISRRHGHTPRSHRLTQTFKICNWNILLARSRRRQPKIPHHPRPEEGRLLRRHLHLNRQQPRICSDGLHFTPKASKMSSPLAAAPTQETRHSRIAQVHHRMV